ncbi:MAG TPA: heparan-alpha-glucosaminide N-acetyltransferase domain-containing protein, partial [Pyrinomonadaceae bacterium]|nr:heparan-alpha-glucosaminide N-acetyltransferase domain-containing protein [Pyrinomonadaceae bacterium]
PTDLSKTTTAIFLTRWVTHYCAPIFVFLAGAGIYLQLARGKSKSELSKFLLTRGLWLIFLELTVVRFGVFFNLDIRFLGFLQVIWVIGLSMVIMAALIHLPLRVIGAFGVLMIFLHNLLDRFQVQGWRGPGSPIPSALAKLWMVLHQPFSVFPILPVMSPVVAVVYNLLPWLGVMAAGFAFGSIYTFDAARRRRWLLALGGAATVLFIALRAINIYGDPARWSGQKNAVFTVLSFINTTKYPPSLLFLLMTLGPAMLFLALFESGVNVCGPLRNPLVTFGRVPLFFYFLQWYVAHSLAILIGLLAGQPVSWQWESPIDKFTKPPLAGIGFPLWVVYLCWIGGVLLIYPLCKWFAGVKARRRDWWLSYL